MAEYIHKETEGELIIERRQRVPLGEFVETHLQVSELENSPRWVKEKKYIFRTHLIPFFGEHVHLSVINKAKIEKYRAHRSKEGANPKTINNEVRVLIRLMNHAAEAELINPREIPRIKKLKESSGRLRFLSTDEMRSFLDTSKKFGEDIEAVCYLLLLAGLRRHEAIFLRWLDVDLDRRQIHIIEHDCEYHEEIVHFVPKGKKNRIVGICDPLQEFLKERREKRAEDPLIIGSAYCDTLERCVPKIAAAAGIRCDGEYKVTAHTLRHTFASHLVMAGVTLYEVASLLGHSSIETTKIYAHLAPDHLNNVVRRLDSLLLN